MKTTKRYIFFSGPGHGWLRVPVIELMELRIAAKITPYSYINGAWAYLEEDCDYATFADAYKMAYGGFEFGEMVEFKKLLQRASAALPDSYSLEVSVELRVLDESRRGYVRMQRRSRVSVMKGRSKC